MPFLSKSFSAEKISLWFVLIFFTGLTFFFRNIPFFWDGDLLSQEAHFYFGNNFSSFVLPPMLDRDGTPVLYAVYLAAAWKLLGKTLLASHIALLPFLLGTVREYYNLAKKFLSSGMIPFAMLLLIFEPTFTTQSILMGYDIALVCFFLMALNALLSSQTKLCALALTLMGLCSVRGIILAITLMLIHILILLIVEKKFRLKEFRFYIFPFLIFTLIAVVHHAQAGWFFISPSPDYAASREFVSANMMLRQAVYVLWYIGDFGRVVPWLILTGIFFYLFVIRRQTAGEPSRKLMIILSAMIAVQILSLSPFSNPVSHRYFICIMMLSLIVLCHSFELVKLKQSGVMAAVVFCCVALVTGNFWLYSGGFSNGWDSSLKVLPWFEIKNEMHQYVLGQKINPEEIGTKFPVYQNTKFTDLSSADFHYTDMGMNTDENYKYVLLSNISNQFTVEEKKRLNENWLPVHELQQGQLYLKLFKNPNQVSSGSSE